MLVRQSTSVPNTSKNSALTIMSNLSGQSQQVSQRNKLHTIVKERNASW
jgi:hypothetical protein